MYVSPWMADAVVRQEDFDVGYRQGPLTPEVDDQWHAVWEEILAGAESSETTRRSRRRADRVAREGVQYPRWYWPSFALPGILWLLILFVLPLYTVVSIAFGTVDPIFRIPCPCTSPGGGAPSTSGRRWARSSGSSSRCTCTPSSTWSWRARLSRSRLCGRVLRGPLRRQAQGPVARPADLPVLDQLPDADARVDEPPGQRRVHQQVPDVRQRRGPPGRLARGPTAHRDHGSRVRLHPVHDPAPVRLPRPDRPSLLESGRDLGGSPVRPSGA